MKKRSLMEKTKKKKTMEKLCRSFFVAFLIAIPVAAILGIFVLISFIVLSVFLSDEQMKDIISVVWGITILYCAYGIALIGTLAHSFLMGKNDERPPA